jgi:hypothetical protein
VELFFGFQHCRTAWRSFVTSAMVFERLGIKANFAYIEQRLAYERLKAGEIDASPGQAVKIHDGYQRPGFAVSITCTWPFLGMGAFKPFSAFW